MSQAETIPPEAGVFRHAGSLLALTAVVAVMIGIYMLPHEWSGNEVNYFDLALRSVRPELFGPYHAVFDGTNARFLSHTIIGETITALGMEEAKVLLGFVTWALTTIALVALIRALGLGVIEATAALTVFVALTSKENQALVGREWLFWTVEAKSFAYIAVFAALAAALRARYWAAILLLSLATYLHFLVGGFWIVAVLGLQMLATRNIGQTLRLFAGFAVAVAPMFVLLLRERYLSEVDMTGIDHTIDWIYSIFINHHHISPFYNHHWFLKDWMPGFVTHIGLAGAFAYLAWTETGKLRHIALGLAILNAYFLLALLLSYLDRQTHALGAFYLFRPSALTFLLSLLVLAGVAGRMVSGSSRRTAGALVFILAAAFALPRFALPFEDSTVEYATLDEQIGGDARALYDWIRANTSEDEIVLLEPTDGIFMGEESHPFVAFERLTGRPTLVSYRFPPTYAPDIVRWYRRVQWRSALFDGDCELLADYPVSLLVFRSAGAPQALADCVSIEERIGPFSLGRPT